MILLAIPTIAASIACLLALAWFLARPLSQESLATRRALPDGPPPKNAQHFPQLRHPLACNHSPYVKLYTSPQTEKHWRNDRRDVLQGFLFSLGEDFARLQQLAALTSALSPKESAQRRSVPLSLPLQFRANYRLATLLLRMRSPASTPRIIRLAELLGILSAHTEASMAKLTHLPTEESWPSLSKIRPD